MAKQTISKFVSVAALGILVFIFGFIFLVIAAQLLGANTPHIGSFAFAVSRRAFNIALATSLVVVAAALFLFARVLRRRLH